MSAASITTAGEHSVDRPVHETFILVAGWKFSVASSAAFIARSPVASGCCTRVTDPSPIHLSANSARNSSPFCNVVIV